MISGSVEWRTSDALIRRIQALRDATRPGSRVQSRAFKELRQIVEDDHHDKLQRGVDRYGRPQTLLAQSSTKKRPGGAAKPLIPRGPRSWPWRTFTVSWTLQGDNTTMLTAKYDHNPVIVNAHEKGASKPGTRWKLPARPTMGITPKGWSRIRQWQKQLAADILKSGGGR